MDWSVIKRARKEDFIEKPGHRGVLFIWAVVIVAAGGLLFAGYAWAQKSVALVVDGQEKEIHTFAGTVGDVLAGQGVILGEKDEVFPDPAAPVENGIVVVINRAAPVNITVDGHEFPAPTCRYKVGEVLAEYGVNLGPADEVSPAPDTEVVAGMEIVVTRVNTATEYKDVPVAYVTRRNYTTELSLGAMQVVRGGENGVKRQWWQVTYRDGREVERSLTKQEVLKPPVDRILRVGSEPVVSRGGEPLRYTRVLEMLATAYTYTGNNTASGKPPRVGVAAVDTRVIPMYTRLYVEGYGYAVALDRGGAIKGNRIDLFYETGTEARRWGVRKVKVYILE
ncbi:MAG: DUF348 domain-containing protein [Peptococcaceae bacterium]|nr:MAG: DUF348 domain-containing protein [Peptococcaceae bacterium]